MRVVGDARPTAGGEPASVTPKLGMALDHSFIRSGVAMSPTTTMSYLPLRATTLTSDHYLLLVKCYNYCGTGSQCSSESNEVKRRLCNFPRKKFLFFNDLFSIEAHDFLFESLTNSVNLFVDRLILIFDIFYYLDTLSRPCCFIHTKDAKEVKRTLL